jgi:hypothetical protein
MNEDQRRDLSFVIQSLFMRFSGCPPDPPCSFSLYSDSTSVHRAEYTGILRPASESVWGGI